MSLRINPPELKERRTIKLLVLIGCLFFITFLVWFSLNARPGLLFLYVLLLISLSYKSLRLLHEWYHYLDISVPKRQIARKPYKVDMLTTYCKGEPIDMVKDTLAAMKNVRYPHTSYLCDEADDPELKKFCANEGIVHVTRKEKTDAKAGNINNALKQADGELCIILDPDHIPEPDFIDRVVPYFNDENVGYVQCVQPYSNFNTSLVSRGACQQTFHFYGPMMMSMNSYGTSQAIGANCTFRRKALDSIGGHAAGLTEDMHTAMRIHSKGWKSKYIPEYLTKGLVPESLSAFCKQQLKWSRGSFELLFEVYPKLFKCLTWRQKLHYLTIPLFFLSGIITLIDFLIPILALLLSSSPILTEFHEFIYFYTPVLFIHICIRLYSQRWLGKPHEKGLHIFGGILRIGSWYVYSMGFIYSILKIKVPYIPTPKDNQITNEWRMIIPHIGVILLSIFAIKYGLAQDSNPYNYIMAGFAGVNIFTLLLCSLFGLQAFVFNVKRFIHSKYLLGLLYLKTRYTWLMSRFIAHKLFTFIRGGVEYAFGIMVLIYICLFLFKDYKYKQYVEKHNKVIKHYSNRNLTPVYSLDDQSEVSKAKNIQPLFVKISHEKPLNTIPEIKAKNIVNHNGNFYLLSEGKEIYIKGIAYNLGHNWRDGNIPLSRRYLEKDFQKIKNMGANTIRRYDPSVYDENILNVASELGLKIFYGFWFKQHIDYSFDTVEIQKYHTLVIKKVEQYKDDPTILAWNLGNEVWGILGKTYTNNQQLKVIRRAYVKMINELAREVHEIDPERPVFTTLEHSPHLSESLEEFYNYAPELDGICVNSYYEENISNLNELIINHFPGKPYIVSEFGPKGYWQRDKSDYDKDDFLVEQDAVTKAEWYVCQWENFIQPHKGTNLGGVAYSWRDRLEGTMTWYGITDIKDRLKPAYFALQESWTDEPIDVSFQSLHIMGKEEMYISGKTYPFRLITRNPLVGNYEYEWLLVKNEYLEKKSIIHSCDDDKVIQIQIPEEPGIYRLYVFQIDEEGNVNTASKPLNIYFKDESSKVQ